MARSEPDDRPVGEPKERPVGERYDGLIGGPHDRPVGEPYDRPVRTPYDGHTTGSGAARAPGLGTAHARERGATCAPVRRRAFRHCFLPGKLIAGLVLAGTAGAYAGDAAGAWHTPAYLALPVILGGLLLAGAASWLSYRGRRRAARAESTENTAAPASTSGSQAIK